MSSIDFAKRSGFHNNKRKSSLMDRRFIPRVKEYIQVLQDQPTIEEVIDYLQDSFPEYARKKRAALRQYVIIALNTTEASKYGRGADRTSELEDNYLSKRQKRSSMDQKEEELNNDSDNSLNDDELVDYKDTNIINNSMQNLYKTAAINKDKVSGRPVPAAVIDLTDNASEEKNHEPVTFQSPSRPSVQITSKTNTPASPRHSVQASPRHGVQTVARNLIPSSPRQNVNTSGTQLSQRQGLQVFAKSSIMKDIPTKSKINIHSSFMQEELENGNCIPQSGEETESSYPVVLDEEKPNLKSVIVSTAPAQQITNTNTNIHSQRSLMSQSEDQKNIYQSNTLSNIVNKNLISISEDERNVPSRPSTPSNKTKGQRMKSDAPKEHKRKFEPTVSNKTFKDIGGYESCIQEVSKLLLHLKHPEVFTRIGIKPPRGFLLHGPPGCGKTLLANAIAGELGLPFFKIAATEVVSGISGDSEQRIRSLFADAVSVAPSILFIDEIDSITPKRENAGKEMERRVVTQILTCMDDLNDSLAHVLVIGATNRPDCLDPALRRAGRFDREIAMGIPDRTARKTILKVICCNLRLSPDIDFEKIAVRTPGYVGADIEALVREAAMCAVDSTFKSLEQTTISKTQLPIFNSRTYGETTSFKETNSTAWLRDQSPLSEDQLASLYITTEHFENALLHVQPSAKREGFATVPDVTWNDIGALEDIREELTMAIMAPVQNPEEFESLGLVTPPGILLCGPPGCGKTLLAKAISNEAGVNFISVKGPELLNMYVGESEKAVRQVFQRARISSPCVIFFDEIDALCPKRSHGDSNVSSRVVNQLLTEMDGLESRKNVFIMGATNRPDILDGAILRPGRMDKQLYVGLPNATDRAKILCTITKSGTKPILSADISVEQLASDPRCEGYSGADLGALVREASVAALKEFMRKPEDTEDELSKVSSDLYYDAAEDLKVIAVTCPSASDENSSCSMSSNVQDVTSGSKSSNGEVCNALPAAKTENILTAHDEIDNPSESLKDHVKNDSSTANDSDSNVEKCQGTKEQTLEPTVPSDVKENADIEMIETAITQKELGTETNTEGIDTISLYTDSPATTDFQVGSVDDDHDTHIILDTSSEVTNEDIGETGPPYLDAPASHADVKMEIKTEVKEEMDELSSPSPPSKSTQAKKIIVTKKHFELAFKKVQPSVSAKDRIWYEKMKVRNSQA